MRLWRPLVAALWLLVAATAAAYPEVLFARVTSEPAVPRPGEPFSLHVLLTDSAERRIPGIGLEARLTGVGEAAEGAVQPGRAQAPGAGPARSLPMRTALAASEDAGSYRGRLEPLAAGRYRLRLVELVAGSEASGASGEFTVDGETTVDLELVLPAADGGLGGWVVWLVGLPLLAGLLIALLLLTGRRRADSQPPDAATGAAAAEDEEQG